MVNMSDYRWRAHAKEVGTVNEVHAYIGGPGTGKTIELLTKATELQRGAYVLAHDPNLDFAQVFPKGHKMEGKPIPLKRYETLSAIRKALTIDPRGIHCTHGDPTELVSLAIEIAEQEQKEVNGKTMGIPVYVCVDEIVSWHEAKRNRIGTFLEDFLARRRHYHVGLLYGAQYPRMMHYSLLHQANHIHMFRMNEQPDLKRLLEGGVPQAIITQVQQLGKFKHVTYSK